MHLSKRSNSQAPVPSKKKAVLPIILETSKEESTEKSLLSKLSFDPLKSKILCTSEDDIDFMESIDFSDEQKDSSISLLTQSFHNSKEESKELNRIQYYENSANNINTDHPLAPIILKRLTKLETKEQKTKIGSRQRVKSMQYLKVSGEAQPPKISLTKPSMEWQKVRKPPNPCNKLYLKMHQEGNLSDRKIIPYSCKQKGNKTDRTYGGKFSLESRNEEMMSKLHEKSRTSIEKTSFSADCSPQFAVNSGSADWSEEGNKLHSGSSESSRGCTPKTYNKHLSSNQLPIKHERTYSGGTIVNKKGSKVVEQLIYIQQADSLFEQTLTQIKGLCDAPEQSPIYINDKNIKSNLKNSRRKCKSINPEPIKRSNKY